MAEDTKKRQFVIAVLVMRLLNTTTGKEVAELYRCPDYRARRCTGRGSAHRRAANKEFL